MALNSLALTRIYQMSKSTDTILTNRHMDVLDYAWSFYRNHSLGPLYQNIQRNTGVSRKELGEIFPNGLNSVFTWIGIPIQGKNDGCKAMVSLDVDDLREVYLDYNATAPIRPEVSAAMINFLENPRSYGNASSAYDLGSIAYDTVDRARQKIATCLSVKSDQIYFTGSGTESNNLAIKGLLEAHPGSAGHLITSCVEHPSVLQLGAYLETQGHSVTYLPVQKDGSILPDDVRQAIRPDTVAVSIMAANNEIGTVYPIAEIGEICQQKGVLFHVDAIQAFGKIPLKPVDLGITVLTMSGHKIGAPKGVGAIYVSDSVKLATQIHGGSQESGLRAGTENVLGIHAMGLASELAHREMEQQTKALLGLREYFLKKLNQTLPDVVIHGSLNNRLPNNLSLGFPGVDSGSMLLSLNQIGIYVSAGSACSAGNDKYSHVLEAIGVNVSRFGTIRFSFGTDTSIEDLDYLFEHLPAVVHGLES